MVIRGDGNVLGDEVVPGSREGVARLCCRMSSVLRCPVVALRVGCLTKMMASL